VIGRALAQAMGESLKQQVVVENRPGANGNLGADAVAKSPADGHTLLMSSGGAMTVNPFLYANMPFDPQRDLVPLASCARVLVFLLAHPSVPAVPYRGAAPALTDLLAGQVQFMFDPGPGLRHAREGRLKMLAVGSPRRASQYPDVPTLAESGFAGLAGFDADTVFGLYAPGGTPAAVVELLHAEANKALALPRVQEAIRTLGAEPMIGTRADFVARQAADRARFGAFIREAKISTD
jgi:tripartite-type tricarboxylate transporter receptor subunit TctC